MKTAIYFGYIDNKTDANVKIAENIASQLSNLGHEVTLLGVSKDIFLEKSFTELSDSGAYKIVHMTENPVIRRHRARLEKFIEKNSYSSRKSSVIKYTLKHPLSAAVLMYSFSPFYKEDISVYSSDSLKNYIVNNNIDAVLAITAPSFTVSALFHQDIPDCKKIIYQLDPYGLHELYKPKEDETVWFNKADCIFTTEILKEKYSEHKDYSIFDKKIHALNFPSFIKPVITEKTSYLEKTKTNIVFCGAIEDRYRKPDRFLELISEQIKIDPQICVHFIGRIKSQVCTTYAEKYPENIFIHPFLDSKYIPSLLDEADFLLNIGNSLKLQLPSKIFEYFATGKPIIHQETIPECTCRKYMQEYPLAFTVHCDSDISLFHDFQKFITQNKGVTIPFNTVNEMYSEYTPEAVASEIHKIISNL